MSQRRAVVALIIAASTLGLGACGFQSPPVTDHEHNSIQGRDFSVGTMRVRNAHIVSELTSSGPKPYLVVSFVNTGTAADGLTGITSPNGTVSISGQGVFNGSLAIPARASSPITLQEPFAAPGAPNALLVSSTTPGAGTYVPMTFSFGTAGSSGEEQIPVVPSSETTAPSVTLPTTRATPPPADAPPSG